jgi:hypothetical protein
LSNVKSLLNIERFNHAAPNRERLSQHQLLESSMSTIAQLKQLLSLEEKRAALMQQIESLDATLGQLKKQLVSGSSSPAPAAAAASPRARAAAAPMAKATRSKAKGARGELKSAIFSALESAGSSGVKVIDLAKSLGTKPANIYAWFHAALKRYPEIKKLSGAQYRLAGKASDAAAPAKAPIAAKAPKRAKAPKAKPTKGGGGIRRGALQEKITAALKSAGPGGITIKDLSEKIGSPYRNLQVWFATTGKKTPGIKKIAKATYRLS